MTRRRYASPNELRTISREDLGWYNNVVLGAVYTFTYDDGDDDASSVLRPEHYYPALRRIVEKHPFLTVVVRDGHGDKAYYEHVSSMDMRDHVAVLPQGHENGFAARDSSSCKYLSEEKAKIEGILPELADHAYAPERPPWSMIVMPLSLEKEAADATVTWRCFIAFAFSHVLGDGMNGLTFHENLLEGLRDSSSSLTSPSPSPSSPIITIPSSTALDEPFDTPQRLPISWGYLLRPLFAVCLPQWFAILFGIRASTSTLDAGTWIGPPMFDNNKHCPSRTPSSLTGKSGETRKIIEKDTTNLRIIDIPASHLEAALAQSRAHGAKLTGVLHQIIVHALSDALPERVLRPRRRQRSRSMSFSLASSAKDAGSSTHISTSSSSGDKYEPAMAITNFASQTAINMRPTLDIPNTKMGLYVNGCFDYHPRRGFHNSEENVDHHQQRRRQHPSTSATTKDSASETSGSTGSAAQTGPLTDREWAAARATTEKLSLCAATLKDQPVGLLRYAPSVRGWMAKKMGQRRDCSYEVSNLLAFKPPTGPTRRPERGGKGRVVGLEWIVFAQPRNPTSAPVVFDVVSVKGGNLVISAVWQAGALGDVAVTVEDEERLVEEVCQGVKEEFAKFVE